MTNPTTPQSLLSESDVERIATRKTNSHGSMVNLPVAERDALIRDWRALRAERDSCEALEQMNIRLTTGLVNIYHVITGKACPHGVALGMTTSAVSSLKSENAALREQLAEARTENERLASQLKQWQEDKDTRAGYL